MEYILKSHTRFICTMAQRLLRKSGIKSEVEAVLHQNRTYGLAVAEDDLAKARRELWGRGKEAQQIAQKPFADD